MTRKRYFILAIFLLVAFASVLSGLSLSLHGAEVEVPIATAAEIMNQDIPLLEFPFGLVFIFAIGVLALTYTILRLKQNRVKLSSIHEEELSQRQFLENIIYRMPIGICIIDVSADDFCIYINDKYILYSGLNPEEIDKKHLTHNKKFQKVKHNILQNKAPVSVEGINIWKNALTERYLRATSTPIYNEKGECIFIISDIIDLTNVHINKIEAEESLFRLRAFVDQNVASIGFFMPVYEDNIFTGVTIEETNAAYRNMFNKLDIDAGSAITSETPGCEWLMDAFAALHFEPEKPYTFKNLYIEPLDRYIFGYAFWCSEDPAFISIYITDKSEEIFLRSSEARALDDLAKNIVALATLNDKIRNPLSIMVSVMEMYPLPHEDKLLSIVQVMDSFIDTLDLGFTESTVLYHAIEKQNDAEKAL